MSENQKRVPERREVPEAGRWDLSGVFPSDGAWAAALGEYEKMTEKLPSFRGTLARSAESLAGWMDFSRDCDILGQRLWLYAFARRCEDERAPEARAMMDKGDAAMARSRTAASWARPEILAIPEELAERLLGHPRLAEYRVFIRRILRERPHSLSAAEERIAALYEECALSIRASFSALAGADIGADYGADHGADSGTGEAAGEKTEPGEGAQWRRLLESPDREIRRKAYEKSCARWESAKTALASLAAGEIRLGAIRAKARGHSSARAAALFADNIGEEACDGLIAAIGENLGAAHRYHALKRRAAGAGRLRAYDLALPLAGAPKRGAPWGEAACLVSDALSPLGGEYASSLREWLLGRSAGWRPGPGKFAGAGCIFAYGCSPLMTMQYGGDRIGDIACAAHESGHAMHVRLSMEANPFRHFLFSAFEGETASAFHEEMLFRHMMKAAAGDSEMRLCLASSRAEALSEALYGAAREAELELALRGLDEAGEPLSAGAVSAEHNRLLEKYRGPEFAADRLSGLGGLFCAFNQAGQPFYGYRYAFGAAAAIALADRVLGGGESERADYIRFLKSGGSRFPLDALRLAGADMSRPDPVHAACRAFAGLVAELEGLLEGPLPQAAGRSLPAKGAGREAAGASGA